MTKKLIVVGAGPVGCLAATALANMGWEVEIYEARPGIPLPFSSPLSTFFHITVV
jgi:kynurenine 3-monooxygenase